MNLPNYSAVAKIALLLSAALLTGCASLSYYAQAVGGHLNILRHGRPIQTVIDNSTTPPGLKDKLNTVQRLRQFASRELGLPDNDSYRYYADLQQPYVAWNVFAAAEFSVTSKEWCFVFAGCVSYRGYFSEAEAKRYAGGLRAGGYDAYVGGVTAYSTLGWFNDPILNTFIGYPEHEIAQIIFHELAHQVVYAKNDSAFNESFAMTVQYEGMRRWLERYGTPAQRSAYNESLQRKRAFIDLILKYRGKLANLYATRLNDAQKRALKEQTWGELQADYTQLTAPPGWSKFRFRLAQQPNNAQLASIAIYSQLIPAFQNLLAQCRSELPCFYKQVRILAKLDSATRNRRLAQLDYAGNKP